MTDTKAADIDGCEQTARRETAKMFQFFRGECVSARGDAMSRRQSTFRGKIEAHK